MGTIGELEFKVQVLARCLGSALGLGRPIRVQIHYCNPQVFHYCNPQVFNAGQLGAGVSPFNSEEVGKSQPHPLASFA
jgi:hypothetical protein